MFTEIDGCMYIMAHNKATHDVVNDETGSVQKTVRDDTLDTQVKVASHDVSMLDYEPSEESDTDDVPKADNDDRLVDTPVKIANHVSMLDYKSS